MLFRSSQKSEACSSYFSVVNKNQHGEGKIFSILLEHQVSIDFVLPGFSQQWFWPFPSENCPPLPSPSLPPATTANSVGWWRVRNGTVGARMLPSSSSPGFVNDGLVLSDTSLHLVEFMGALIGLNFIWVTLKNPAWGQAGSNYGLYSFSALMSRVIFILSRIPKFVFLLECLLQGCKYHL